MLHFIAFSLKSVKVFFLYYKNKSLFLYNIIPINNEPKLELYSFIKKRSLLNAISKFLKLNNSQTKGAKIMKTITFIDEILPDEVAKEMRKGKSMSIIDVREDEEVAQGKIPSARHIPLGQLENRLDEIEKDQEHIMVCRSGSRSGMATNFLKDKGFKVKNMVGGMLEWKDEIER